MKTEPNHSAFSRPYSHDERPSGGHESDRVETFREQGGLTKREYFAAMALQALITGNNATQPAHPDDTKRAVEYADALINELNKAK